MEPATFTGVSHSTGFKDSGIFYITGSTSSSISAGNTLAPPAVAPAHVWTPRYLGAVLHAFQPKRSR